MCRKKYLESDLAKAWPAGMVEKHQRALTQSASAPPGLHRRGAAVRAADATSADERPRRTWANPFLTWADLAPPARAENVLVLPCSPSCSSAFIVQIVFRYLAQPPDRLDVRTEHDRRLDLAGAVGRGLRPPRDRGGPLRPHLRQRRRAATRRAMVIATAASRRRALRHVAAGGGRLRHLHEGRRRPPTSRSASTTCSRSMSSSPSPSIVRYLWLGWRAIRSDGVGAARPGQDGLGRMNLASPFSISIVALTALALLGLPIGHAMIGAIGPLPVAGRAGHGDGRRAVPERHVHQLHHPLPCRCSSSRPS